MITFVLSGKLPAILHARDLERIGRSAAKRLRLKKPHSVGLTFVSPKRMQALNNAYLHKDRPTDVLSFPSAEMPLPVAQRQAEAQNVGDIVVCPSYAREEAKRRSISPKEEIARLIVHGVLHLKGYDHATEEDEMNMFSVQEKILEEAMK